MGLMLKHKRLSADKFEDALKIERLKTENGYAGNFAVCGHAPLANLAHKKKKHVAIIEIE